MTVKQLLTYKIEVEEGRECTYFEFIFGRYTYSLFKNNKYWEVVKGEGKFSSEIFIGDVFIQKTHLEKL